MKGDFSRFNFDPRKHYAGVLHQQGRVWLDSDWNEDVLERLDQLRQQLSDLVGRSGVPEPGTAFQISPGRSGVVDDFLIGAGRCYVNGILCQLEAAASYLSQPDLPQPSRLRLPTDGSTSLALVFLEVWDRLVTYLEDDTLREVALQGPDTAARLKTVAQVKIISLPSSLTDFGDKSLAKFLPTSGNGTLTTLQPPLVTAPDPCLLPDPGNFTGRENHLYRVQIHDGGDVIGASTGFAANVRLAVDAAAGARTLTLATPLNANQIEAAQRAGNVTVTNNGGTSERVPLAGISLDGKTLALALGLHNSYAVAANAAITSGVATFKWSRDNASFAVGAAVQNDGVTLTLSSLGRDTATALQIGDLVEITNDASELGPAQGFLTFLAAVPDPDGLTVVLNDPVPNILATRTPSSSPPASPPTGPTAQPSFPLVLRRWDGRGDANAIYSDISTPALNLGDGVHIQFGGSNLRAGDYWNFTTRSADGSIEPLTNAPPAGIARHRCPLAVVSFGPPPLGSPPSSPPQSASSTGLVLTVLQDCRNLFPALIHFPAFQDGVHVTGVFVLDPVQPGRTTALANDTVVQVSTFGGIAVQCDAEIDPTSISHATCYLTVENPIALDGQGNAGGYETLKLTGNPDPTSSPKFITLRPSANALQLLNAIIPATPPSDRGILARLTLKGNFIWDLRTGTLNLDGEAFANGINAAANTALSLPSGNRRRGSDFETWFWLVAAPVTLTGIQADSLQVFAGQTATLTLTLSGPAPAGGIPFTITASNTLVSFVNPPTTIPGGQTSITITVQTVPVVPNKIGQTNITASLTTSPPGPVTITLTIAQPALIAPLSIIPTSIFTLGSAAGQIILTSPAPSKTPVVTLSSSNTQVATVAPTSITIPVGGISTPFTVVGHNPGTATITASFGTSTASGTITVTTRPTGKEKREKEIAVEKGSLQVEKAVVSEQLRPAKTIETRPQFSQQGVISADPAIGPGNLLETRDQVPAAGQAFIRPEERPSLGQEVLNQDSGARGQDSGVR
jgi:Family of unknown function (DUF6519)